MPKFISGRQHLSLLNHDMLNNFRSQKQRSVALQLRYTAEFIERQLITSIGSIVN